MSLFSVWRKEFGKYFNCCLSETKILCITFQEVRMHAHRWLVSSAQNNDADFQVTPGPRAGVIRIAQEEPFPHYSVACTRYNVYYIQIY